MAVGIGAAGILGVGRETTNGTYIVPEKYIPILSEDLKIIQSNIYRRPIRGIVDPVGAVAGFQHAEGSVTVEATDDILPYFMWAMRGVTTKTGTTPNWIYTLVPNAEGQKSGSKMTLSLTVVRNAIVFAYVGCVVNSFEFTTQEGLLVCTLNILGMDEAVQSAPTATWPTTVPPGPGEYSIEIPTSTEVVDVDNFTFSVDEGGEPAYRLRDDSKKASFISFGERSVTLSLERDFESRTDYDAFKIATAQGIKIDCKKGTNNYITLTMNAAIKDSYEVGLSGQGDLVRASIEYQGVYSVAGSQAYGIIVGSQETLA